MSDSQEQEDVVIVDRGTIRLGLERARAAAEAVSRELAPFTIEVFLMTEAQIQQVVRRLDAAEDEHGTAVAIGFRLTSWCAEQCLWAANWTDGQEVMEQQLRVLVEVVREFRESLIAASDELLGDPPTTA